MSDTYFFCLGKIKYCNFCKCLSKSFTKFQAAKVLSSVNLDDCHYFPVGLSLKVYKQRYLIDYINTVPFKWVITWLVLSIYKLHDFLHKTSSRRGKLILTFQFSSRAQKSVPNIKSIPTVLLSCHWGNVTVVTRILVHTELNFTMPVCLFIKTCLRVGRRIRFWSGICEGMAVAYKVSSLTKIISNKQ